MSTQYTCILPYDRCTAERDVGRLNMVMHNYKFMKLLLDTWFPGAGHSAKKRTLNGPEKDLPSLHKDLFFAIYGRCFYATY